MSEKVDQRICITFCQKLGDSCKETFDKLLHVYGEECMSRACVYEWYKRFQDGRESVESDKRPRRPSTSKNDRNVAAVRAAIRGNRRLTVREIAEDIGLSFGSVQSILTEDLGMRRVSAKFVPKLLSSDQTITKKYYVQVLTRLRDAVRRKRPMLHAAADWLLHHDNAPAHASHLVQQFLANHQIPQVNQPPYLPDLAPCDFFLFPKLKFALKGRRFDDVDDIKKNATEQLRRVEQKDFQNCFQQWQERWTKCIVSEGDYFEGD